MWSTGCCQTPYANKYLTRFLKMNGKMIVWKCKLIFPIDTLQQTLEITDLNHFLAGENTSVLIILATTLLHKTSFSDLLNVIRYLHSYFITIQI